MARRTARPYFDRALQHVRAQQPHFFAALVADARFVAQSRGERDEFHGRLDAALQALRLMFVTDAFFAQACYRAQARLDALGLPALAFVAKRLAMVSAQVCVGRTVLIHPGILIGHGQVVIDGFAEIHSGVSIFPWVSIGLRGSNRGPTIESLVRVGTGAKVLGALTVHRGAKIGANAVVIDDVPAGVTVVGAPARPVADADAV